MLFFAGLTGLIAGTLAMGAVEYSKLRVDLDRQLAELEAERAELESAPDAELDELTRLYVSRGLSEDLARRVAVEFTAHDALAAHAEAELGITEASRATPVRDAIAVSAAFAGGALLPWLAMLVLPAPYRVTATFVIVLLALAFAGWVAARISGVRPAGPVIRTAAIGGAAMLITYAAGHFMYP